MKSIDLSEAHKMTLLTAGRCKNLDTALLNLREIMSVVSPNNLQQLSLRPREGSQFRENSQLHKIVYGELVLNQETSSRVSHNNPTHRRSYSKQEYGFIISAWEKGINIHQVADALGKYILLLNNI